MHIHRHLYTHVCMHMHTCMHTRMHTHTHTHIVQTNRRAGQCCLVKIFREEKCPEFAFEGRESSRVPDVLGRLFQLQGQFSVCSHKCVCLLHR